MGTLVRFHLRDHDAEAKTEAILAKIGDLYEQQLKVKDELPKVLATLVALGQHDAALLAIADWGTGRAEPWKILRRCSELVASTERPLSDDR